MATYTSRYPNYDKNVQTPYYELIINRDATIPLNQSDNIKVVFRDKGSNSMQVTFSDPDLKLMEENIILEDAPITLKYGWKGNPLAIFNGYISVIDFNFPEDGLPTMVITAMDNTHLMNRFELKRTWKNAKISDVVKQIYGEYGFKVTVDDTGKKLESIEQSDQTDIAFIESLCDKVEGADYITYTNNNEAFFVKRKLSGKASKVFNYRKEPYSLKSFSPRINKERQKTEMTKYELDVYNNTVKKYKVDINTHQELLGEQKVVTTNKRK